MDTVNIFYSGILFNPNLSYETLTDSRDNQTYKTIKIGTQTWMAQNLNYAETDTWCYNDSTKYCDLYGRLYDWNTAMQGAASSNNIPSGVKGICPTGWHLPSDAEWDILANNLGGLYVAGGKMKETGTIHWNSPNTGADNSSGFTGLPSGYRSNVVCFYSLGDYTAFWTSIEYFYVYTRTMNIFNASLARIDVNFKTDGKSVRCLKD